MNNEPSLLATLIMFLILMPFVIFWFRMFFDCIRNENRNKGTWIFALIFFHILGALAYYYYRKKKKAKIGDF